MQTKKISNYGYLIFPAIFLAVSIKWSLMSNYTWDDDAATRYLSTLNADRNPEVFLDSWVRPLFSVFFYWPIHYFGRMGVVVLMSLLTAFSGIFLYKGLQHKGVENAYVVPFFLLFQTFLFGITRDAMTEPLASFIFSLGLYFYFTDKLALFAIAGSFLPLARTETVLLLPFWALLLLQRRKYFFIPLLGVGVLCWYLGWVFYTGNFHAFFDNLLGSGNAEKRYEQTKITHHFSKLVYVVGPVIYFFFLLGFITNIKKIFKDQIIILQFAAGFVMYGVFSSTSISLGQSGGALRNLITLSPLVAIIALYGFNYWYGIFKKKEETILPITVKQTNKNKGPQKSSADNKESSSMSNKVIIAVFMFFLMLLSVQLLTSKLMFRQFFSDDETDYTIILFLAGCCFLVLISFFGFFVKRQLIIIIPLLLLQTAFTLYYENPDSHSNEERKAINKAVELIKKASLEKRKIYCNNTWFFWSAGVNPVDTNRFGRIDSVSIRNFKPGSIIVWEPHYTGKNYSNIPYTDLVNDTSLRMIYYLQDVDKATRAILFIKRESNSSTQELFERFCKIMPDDKLAFYLKGSFEREKLLDFNLSNKSLSRSIEIDPEYDEPYFERGLNYLNLNKPDSACVDLKKARSLGNGNAGGIINQYCK